MPICDKFKVRLEDPEGNFLGYACAICQAMSKTFQSLQSGYRGCGLVASGAISNHILSKHGATLDRDFILKCSDCGIEEICHETSKGMNPEDCPYFKPKGDTPK